MKIVQVMAGNEEGGLEKHFEELCNALAQEEELHVIAHEKYRERFDEKVFFHSLDLSKGRKNPFILFRLWRMVRDINPDILHAHASKAADIVASISKWIQPSIETVVTVHSKKKKTKNYEKFDYIIGVSKAVLAPINHRHKHVIYNGVDFPKQHSMSGTGINHSKFTICAIGRLVEVKNFALLLDAIKDIDVELVLIGEGEQEITLRKQAKGLGIEEKVIFTGYRSDALDLLAQSDLLVITSHKEGFSYVMAEALLLQKPVISTDVADMSEILPEGYVLKKAKSEDLKDKIVYVKKHYTDVLKNFEKCFEFAKEEFIYEKMYEKLILLYGEMLEESLSSK